MRFSEAFGITRQDDDDWFDRHLTIDTPLFLDPVLLLDAGPVWNAAHGELIDHFTRCYALVAKAISPTSNSAKLAQALLTFPEPPEFGLGYTASGTAGAGSGAGFARSIMDGIAVAIAAGLDSIEHIEEIGIVNEGFGADRISDATCNVLKAAFIDYTQDVAGKHNIPLNPHRVAHIGFDQQNDRWISGSVNLPTNPATGKPLMLVPERLLNDLPVLNANDWFDAPLNNDLRTALNVKVGQRVPKRTIVSLARQHPERVRDWARSQTSRPDLQGYDFANDPLGVVRFDGPAVAFAQAHPLANVVKPKSQTELSTLIDGVLDQYKHFIEQQGGWAALWNTDGTEKPESAAQLMFLAMAQHYLRLFDVEVDREVDLGRGPVDFKVSSGSSMRLLIEIKKAHNGKFWHGLDTQLPSYLLSDNSSEGWLLAIRYRDNKASEERMKELPDMVSKRAHEIARTLRYKAVDARRTVSASKI
jgi:hypothetical protein